MLDSCKMVEKQSEAFHAFLVFFSKFKTILLHIVLLKCQIVFLKFTWCDNQALVGCIPIPAVAVHKMYSNNILNFQESTTILNTHTKKSGNLSYAPCIKTRIFFVVLFTR